MVPLGTSTPSIYWSFLAIRRVIGTGGSMRRLSILYDLTLVIVKLIADRHRLTLRNQAIACL